MGQYVGGAIIETVRNTVDEGETSQKDVISALISSCKSDGTFCAHIETHASHIILTTQHAYKIKKQVRYNFLDYSTVELRRKACAKELRLNRRIAPSLYLAVVPITATGDGARFGGYCTILEWALKMRRFDTGTELDTLAVEGQLTPQLSRELADVVSEFHKLAPAAPGFGGYAGTAATLSELISNLRKAPPTSLDADKVQTWVELIGAQAQAAVVRLNARQRRGHVRECHGDLHLGNICLLEGRPTPFDAIEFNDGFRCIDIAYDVSFLMMDLVHRRLNQQANEFLSRYEENVRDFSGLNLLPLFMSMRAAVRAMVGSLPEAGKSQREEATAFMDVALELLEPRQKPQLIAIGGVSGTGKSTIARGVSAAWGRPMDCIVIRSDSIRKRLAGVPAETKLTADHYSRENSERGYQRLCKDAFHALKAGVAVVVDATFLSAEERRHVERTAGRAEVDFTGLWLSAPTSVLEERIRQRTNDASDATVDILHRQMKNYGPPANWTEIDASGDAEATLALAQAALER